MSQSSPYMPAAVMIFISIWKEAWARLYSFFDVSTLKLSLAIATTIAYTQWL